MIKIVFSDLDGTLLNWQKRPSEQDIKTIAYLESAGIPFCITTGRSWFMTRGYVRMLGLHHPTVAANGAMVVSPDGAILFRRAMLPQNAYRIARRMAEEGRFFRVYTADHIYTYPHAQGFQMLDEYNAIVDPADRTPVLPLPGLEVLLKWEVFKILGHDILPQEGDDYRREFGQLPLNLLTTEGCMLDVTSKEINKGTGVLEICRLYGFSIQDAAVMGDDNNDIMMLQAAGASGAPKNAKPNALSCAGHILPSNNDSPLTYFVKSILKL